jgi:hypothetical protein
MGSEPVESPLADLLNAINRYNAPPPHFGASTSRCDPRWFDLAAEEARQHSNLRRASLQAAYTKFVGQLRRDLAGGEER